MVRVSILSIILLFSTTHLQASFASDSKQATGKPTSLRALRAQMAAQKPTTLAAVVGTIAAIKATAEEQPKNPVFSKAELEKMTVEISQEEATFHNLSKQSNAASLLGKVVVGSVVQGSKSQVELQQFIGLGYKPKNKYERGESVIFYAKDRCYYGLILGKIADGSYQVQVGDAATAHVKAGDISCNTK